MYLDIAMLTGEPGLLSGCIIFVDVSYRVCRMATAAVAERFLLPKRRRNVRPLVRERTSAFTLLID